MCFIAKPYEWTKKDGLVFTLNVGITAILSKNQLLTYTVPEIDFFLFEVSAACFQTTHTHTHTHNVKIENLHDKNEK